MLPAFLSGLVLAYFGSLPVAGPIAVLVAERALTGRRRAALWLAAGAAVPEGVYAWAAAEGAEVLLSAVPDLVPVAHLLGAVALTVIAVTIVRAKGTAARPKQYAGNAFWAGFAVTVLNPALLLTWTAASGPLVGLGWLDQPLDAVAFGVGCGIGGFGGGATLGVTLASQRHRLGDGALRTLRYGSASVLVGFAVWLAVEAVRGWVPL